MYFIYKYNIILIINIKKTMLEIVNKYNIIIQKDVIHNNLFYLKCMLIMFYNGRWTSWNK